MTGHREADVGGGAFRRGRMIRFGYSWGHVLTARDKVTTVSFNASLARSRQCSNRCTIFAVPMLQPFLVRLQPGTESGSAPFCTGADHYVDPRAVVMGAQLPKFGPTVVISLQNGGSVLG